jgi:CRP/FNR family transcriptional regulator, cyclic AMP receptor protein
MKQDRMSVSQGDTIFTEGERGDTMYVIVEGQVQIERKGSKSPVVLATLQPGSFFGEMAVVDQVERTATAVALTDVSLLAVHASELELLLEQRPDVGAKMIRTLVRRLKHTTNQVMDEKEKIAMLFDSGAEARST